MIKFVSGDFFEFDADIMVNTVNCVGVMGAGVALAFKKRFPEMFADYAQKCKAKQIRPGRPSVWIQSDIISKQVEIINFPTKDDWRKPSEYSYIEEGLKWLSLYLKEKEGKMVTLPALGCGHGGLEWEKVKEIISRHLEDSPANIYVFEPSDSIKAGDVSTSGDYGKILKTIGIGIIKSSSPEYPGKLSQYTKKDLFFYPEDDSVFRYDFSLICSTKPSDDEIHIIQQFADLCALHGKSILFGSSSFEKKLSIKLSELGVVCGCILPSGIYDSVKKMRSKSVSGQPKLLSIGNPINSFDKKEFLPSVLGRVHLSDKSIFLTEKLAWLSNFKKFFEVGLIDSYYYNWPTMPEQDKEAAIKIGAKKLEPEFLKITSIRDEIFHVAR